MKSKILQLVEKEKEHLPTVIYKTITEIFAEYKKLTDKLDLDTDSIERNLSLYLKLIKHEINSPTEFGFFHERETSPVDYYNFSIDFFSPFIKREESKICGHENIKKILSYVMAGENVILLSNHQAEADPTILAILLEKLYPGLIKNMISVAGARVTTDPITIPLTLGQNIIRVYSKKYFEIHKDKKKSMQQHNSSAMLSLRHILNRGGKCVFVAPSGGRDRKDKNGNLSPADFDPESIELMRLVGSKSKKTTHYFPLALYTYPVLPPPEKIKKEIGEQRKICHSPVHINFGPEITMSQPTAIEKQNKEAFRKMQAREIHNMVVTLYKEIAE